MNYAANNLRDYYNSKYDQPKSDSEAILTLIKVYQTEMGEYTEKIGDGIGEVYRELLSKGLPSYYWILESIHRTAKKKEEKRHFGYMIGTLRNWSLYGFGKTLTDEEEEIYDFFKEVTCIELSSNARILISSLVGNYGALKVMRSISNLKDTDASTIFAEILGRSMIERYAESIPEVSVSSTPKKKALSPPKQASKRNQQRKPNDNLKLMISYIEDFLKANGVSRPTDIAIHLNELGFNNITPKNITSHLGTVMKNTGNVVKVGVGKYSLKK